MPSSFPHLPASSQQLSHLHVAKAQRAQNLQKLLELVNIQLVIVKYPSRAVLLFFRLSVAYFAALVSNTTSPTSSTACLQTPIDILLSFESANRSSMRRDPTTMTEPKPSSFTVFGSLPPEIQLTIWEVALPCPRDVPEAILVFVNFDLSRPRAILSCIDGLKDLSSEIDVVSTDTWSEDDHKYIYPRSRGFSTKEEVFSLFHTCRKSRAVAGKIYSLDIESNEEWNTELWNPATDTLYLPGLAYLRSHKSFIKWLAKKRERPHPGLQSLVNLALTLNPLFMLTTQLIPDFDNVDDIHPTGFFNSWLRNFPALQMLDLYIDPLGLGERHMGRLVPFEPLDIPVMKLYNLRPSRIEKNLALLLEKCLPQGREAPFIEVFVLCLDGRTAPQHRDDPN